MQRELIQAYEAFYSRRNLLRAASAIPRNGVHPLIFQGIGRWLLKQARPELDDHLSWLMQKEADWAWKSAANPDS